MGNTYGEYIALLMCVSGNRVGSHLWASLVQVSLKSGTNILYWRTTGILVGGKMVKPVLLKNIQIQGKNKTCSCYRHVIEISGSLMGCVAPGVAYTSECFPCRPGWFSPTPGSSSCQACPSNTFSEKGASTCSACPEHYYSRMYTGKLYIKRTRSLPFCSD